MRPRITGLVVVTTALVNTASALLVTENSPCDQQCGNVLSSTTGSEMTCDEKQYSVNAGIVYQNCVGCELKSTYSKGNQTDLQWLLYNTRYAISWCLFGLPDNKDAGSSPCTTSNACGPLLNGLSWQNLTKFGGAYDFCQDWPVDAVPKCSSCLTAGDSHFLSNYLTILDAACHQRPAPGSTLSIEGTPFSTVPMNITTPSATPLYSITPDNSAISLGGKVGIAIGGIIALLALTGCGIVCNGKRRRRAFLRRMRAKHGEKGWPTPPGTDMFETPLSQKPLRGWEDSPVSAGTERTYPRYFSPYSTQYNSPVSAVEGPSTATWPTEAWPNSTQEKLAQMEREQGITGHYTPETQIGLALGGDDPSIRSKPSNQSIQSQPRHPWETKGKDRHEDYELHEVDSNGSLRHPTQSGAPVLSHPGYGRKYSPPQTSHGGLTEDDARRGRAM